MGDLLRQTESSNFWTFLLIMEIIEIQGSSAISKIEFNTEESIVGICYTSSNKSYEFFCEDLDSVKEKIQSAIKNEESIGKLVHSLKKNGEIEPFQSESLDKA